MNSLFIASLIASCFAHSHLECTNRLSNGTCIGFPRYYSTNKAGFENTPESRDRNYIVIPGQETCPVMPGPEYTDTYPMATVTPGEEITIQWPPRGHTKQPSSDVWVYCGNDTSAVATLKYDNCVGSDVSWAVCTGKFTVPDWPAGVQHCKWKWVLGGSQTYIDCFELNVLAKQKSPGQNSSGIELEIASNNTVAPAPVTHYCVLKPQ